MPKIHVSVQNKIARAARCDGSIVCGNTDYEIVFSFDAEWDAFEEKTARFLYDNGYLDIPFRGASCPVPYIINAASVEVGVYAGELHTTTAALIPCRPSVCSNDRAELRPEAVELYRDAALEAAREAKGHAEYADVAASAAKISAEVAFAMTHELREDSEKAAAYAERMEAHAAAYRKRYAFVVGEESELTYMTKDSTGVFTPSSGYRFNDHGAHTTYRYPLEAGVHVCYALWHAHLAQQVLLEASSDGEQWVVLQDTAGKQIGSQNYYDLARVLPPEGAEAIYIRISDSMPEDGFGGAILTDIPVTLDVMYGAEDPLLLPPIGEQDEGAYLRVRGGHWQVAGPESLVSRVYTYSFTVGTNAEKKYLEAGSTGHLNASCRFNDNERVTVYRYRLANAALVRRVLWTATLGQQLRLECSANGEDWVLLDDAGAERRPFARATYDLTNHLNLLAFDEVYVRISDSAPDDGFGGAISRSGRVDLRVERCEPPIGF